MKKKKKGYDGQILLFLSSQYRRKRIMTDSWSVLTLAWKDCRNHEALSEYSVAGPRFEWVLAEYSYGDSFVVAGVRDKAH
jgi:hypothetical protein